MKVARKTLTVDEAAREMRVSAITVRHMLESGTLPKARSAIKGGELRVPAVALQRWMADQNWNAEGGSDANGDERDQED